MGIYFGKVSDGTLFFLCACWWIWKWRNDLVFKQLLPLSNTNDWLQKKVLEVWDSFMKDNLYQREIVEIMIAWNPPNEGWLKL